MYIRNERGAIIGNDAYFALNNNNEVIFSKISADSYHIIKTFDNAEDAQNYLDALYKKLTFNGWTTDTKGTLRNLNMAHKIEIGTSAGKSKVFATFAFSGEKINDPAFYEIATLATFDNEDAAKNYLDELKELLNGVK